MPELDAIKEQTVGGLVFRRDHGHRRGQVPLPWMTPRGGLDYLRSTVKRIIRAAELRDELSFTAPSGANKTSRFVGIAAHSLSE